MSDDVALFALPSAPQGRPRSRVAPAVKRAVAQATHLTDADEAAVALAFRLAADIDHCPLGDKSASGFQAQLLNVLKDLGMTTRSRRLIDRAEGADTAEGVDLLAEISRIRMARSATAAESGG